GLDLTSQGSPPLSTTHWTLNTLLFATFPQLAARKALLSQHGLKVKTKDIDQFWQEAVLLAPWIGPVNIWDPQIWMRVILCKKKRGP
uniref:Uncharacterized protein n=1 Tax=Spermophilus dauricus TaxID=99837 RepID=A0A8C9PHG8_SPEDA